MNLDLLKSLSDVATIGCAVLVAWTNYRATGAMDPEIIKGHHVFYIFLISSIYVAAILTFMRGLRVL